MNAQHSSTAIASLCQSVRAQGLSATEEIARQWLKDGLISGYTLILGKEREIAVLEVRFPDGKTFKADRQEMN